MLVAHVLLFFSFHSVYLDKDVLCALVNWFMPDGDEPDEVTGMWVVEPEHEGNTHMLEVIHLEVLTFFLYMAQASFQKTSITRFSSMSSNLTL